MSNGDDFYGLLTNECSLTQSNYVELNALKCKLFEIGVNCFMCPNVKVYKLK